MRASRPALSQGHVHGQRVEPSREGALAAKLRQLLPSPHKGLLRELLCQANVSAQAQAQRVHAANVLSIERLKGRQVALPRAGDKRPLLRASFVLHDPRWNDVIGTVRR